MDAIESLPAQPPRKRRWFQYSLRSLMLSVLCCAVACSWFATRAAKQREAVRAIRAIDGCCVRYDCEIARFDPDTNDFIPPGRQTWVESILDVDFIHRAVRAQVPLARLIEAAPHLAKLPHLKTVLVVIGFEDDGQTAELEIKRLRAELPDVEVQQLGPVHVCGCGNNDDGTLEAVACATAWVGLFVAVVGI